MLFLYAPHNYNSYPNLLVTKEISSAFSCAKPPSSPQWHHTRVSKICFTPSSEHSQMRLQQAYAKSWKIFVKKVLSKSHVCSDVTLLQLKSYLVSDKRSAIVGMTSQLAGGRITLAALQWSPWLIELHEPRFLIFLRSEFRPRSEVSWLSLKLYSCTIHRWGLLALLSQALLGPLLRFTLRPGFRPRRLRFFHVMRHQCIILRCRVRSIRVMKSERSSCWSRFCDDRPIVSGSVLCRGKEVFLVLLSLSHYRDVSGKVSGKAMLYSSFHLWAIEVATLALWDMAWLYQISIQWFLFTQEYCEDSSLIILPNCRSLCYSKTNRSSLNALSEGMYKLQSFELRFVRENEICHLLSVLFCCHHPGMNFYGLMTA